MNTRRYKIIDEPMPGGLQRWIVDPIWPLLACMMVGALPGLAWLVFNSFALGSPTRIRESLLCIAGLVGVVLVTASTNSAVGSQLLSSALARYALLLAVAWKLCCAYMACFLQQRALELHQYYGGRKANGLLVLMAGLFLPRFMPDVATQTPFLWLLLP